MTARQVARRQIPVSDRAAAPAPPTVAAAGHPHATRRADPNRVKDPGINEVLANTIRDLFDVGLKLQVLAFDVADPTLGNSINGAGEGIERVIRNLIQDAFKQ